ncbi:hypothetical protein E3P89_02752 [Wallemia ichthyophaga]|uniref:sphinganine-1-phosphate aldolase n=1 Tax=Wallemia ichthyophaga TaxID=245174 RepID=A0A4T0I059_WALIC|nr:hypothetical protein E3P90_02768 [Wallemia ichthyophaga]TIB10830.1 hypothetical protein E3P93_02776 [Wallemia ichthyophaga]TIB21247.1 hypothetical protein E3P89_02752 [Wallemia ichthyophaga]TIB22952.1 hypothetical protein E3P88_02787 [Wallemia ichthyophaga]
MNLLENNKNLFKDIFIGAVLFSYLSKAAREIYIYGVAHSIRSVFKGFSRRALLLLTSLPWTKKQIDDELNSALSDLDSKMVIRDPSLPTHHKLPTIGHDKHSVHHQLSSLANIPHSRWEDGRVSGAVYYGDSGDINDVIIEAFSRFSVSNPLHPDVFPGIRAMEAQVVSMVLNMYNAPQDAAGTTTSGGTESILLACLAYRNWSRQTQGVSHPEMVVPETAHAAFSKASFYFGITLRRVPVDPHTRKASLKHVKRAINGNTCMLVASAPNFPDGNVDDIVEMGALAKRYKVGLHGRVVLAYTHSNSHSSVDCCLGSFIMPFLQSAGFATTPFDFRVNGVTSISCDTHKYGFAPKGSSVIMYANKTWRSFQYYSQPDWTGGVYASPTLAGSRPGALIAGTWAVLTHVGVDGYVRSCGEIVRARQRIQRAIETDYQADLAVMGQPLGSVVAFTSVNPALNIYTVGDLLHEKGFSLNAVANPPALHIACTRPTVAAVDDILSSLRWAVDQAKSRTFGKEDEGSMVALYGVGSSTAIGPDLVDYLARGFLDTMYVVS